jgi:hypothetical protein
MKPQTKHAPFGGIALDYRGHRKETKEESKSQAAAFLAKLKGKETGKEKEC